MDSEPITISLTMSTPISPNETGKQTTVEIVRIVDLVLKPILVIFGTIGNGLSFYIMRRTSLKNLSTCFYMSILALADTGLLWSGAAVWWIRLLTRFRVNPHFWTHCKLIHFTYYFCKSYSSSLLVLMSVEKCFALYFPLKAKTICTVRTAKWATAIVAFFFFVYHIQVLIFFKPPSCSPSNQTYEKVLSFIGSTFYCYAPFTIMFIANLAIMCKFIKAKRLSSSSNRTESTSQALNKYALRGTSMVVVVTVIFIILTLPAGFNDIYRVSSEYPIFDLSWSFMQYLNSSINGLLYCIVGLKFRQELFKLLCCCGVKTDVHMNSRNNISSIRLGAEF